MGIASIIAVAFDDLGYLLEGRCLAGFALLLSRKGEAFGPASSAPGPFLVSFSAVIYGPFRAIAACRRLRGVTRLQHGRRIAPARRVDARGHQGRA
jgi:hypothetical protein